MVFWRFLDISLALRKKVFLTFLQLWPKDGVKVVILAGSWKQGLLDFFKRAWRLEALDPDPGEFNETNIGTCVLGGKT